MFLPLLGMSQDSDTTKVTNEVERLIDKYSAKIAESLNTSVEAVVPVIKNVYRSALMKQYAVAFSSAFSVLVGMILIFLAKREYVFELKASNIRKPYDAENPFLWFYTICGLVITTLSLLVFLVSGVKRLIAPEWYAIETIKELL